MSNSAVSNFAGKSQILRFIYHKLDVVALVGGACLHVEHALGANCKLSSKLSMLLTLSD